jgi:hypothetical protein
MAKSFIHERTIKRSCDSFTLRISACFMAKKTSNWCCSSVWIFFWRGISLNEITNCLIFDLLNLSIGVKFYRYSFLPLFSFKQLSSVCYFKLNLCWVVFASYHISNQISVVLRSMDRYFEWTSPIKVADNQRDFVFSWHFIFVKLQYFFPDTIIVHNDRNILKLP